jgi:hypothetical protein
MRWLLLCLVLVCGGCCNGSGDAERACNAPGRFKRGDAVLVGRCRGVILRGPAYHGWQVEWLDDTGRRHVELVDGSLLYEVPAEKLPESGN